MRKGADPAEDIIRSGGHIKIFNLTRRVSELLVITKVLTVFDVFETEQDAPSRAFQRLRRVSRATRAGRILPLC